MDPERPRTQTDAAAPTGPAAADYGQLFAEYAPRVKGYLVRRGLSPAAAEELTQEVMLTVWTKRDTYDFQRGSLSAWVFTIARNRFIDLRRRDRRPQPDPEDPCWVDTMSGSAGPDLHAMTERRAELVREAISQLDQEQRRTLQQLYFEGRSTTEAAAAMGVPVGTVKSRTRRALETLRKRLRGGELEDE